MTAIAFALALYAQSVIGPAPVPPPVASAKVTITVRVIEARQPGPKSLDPRLSDLEKKLAHFNFAQFQLLEEKKFELDMHTPGTMDLPGNRHLTVTPRRMDGAEKIKVHLELVGGQSQHTRYLHTDYAVQRGATLLVGGPKTEEGTLFIALRHDAP